MKKSFGCTSGTIVLDQGSFNLELDEAEEDRKLHTSLPPDIDYRATIIWIGPCRPRNDREDPNRSCPGVFQWLSRRGMNINQFSKLVEGRVPPHTPDMLDHKGFFLAPPRGEGVSLSGLGGAPDRVDNL